MSLFVSGVNNGMKSMKIKNKWLLLAAGIVGLALMIVPQLFSSKDRDNSILQDSTDCEYYSEHLEKKMTELISKVGGVGNVSVVITLDGGSEYVYAANTKTSESGSAVDYIVLNNGEGEGGLVVGQICPRVRGVAVVCSGGSSPSVKKDVTELVSAALGISTSRIKVCGQE